MAEDDQQFLKKLTGGSLTPQFFQYNPLLRYIESVGEGTQAKELIFTSASGIPLIRFNLHDRGDTYSFSQVKKIMNLAHVKSAHQLPFVALWGRSDQTLIFYAANIYPEHIKIGLDPRRFLKKLQGNSQ